MKYQPNEFTSELREKISVAELSLEKLCETLAADYKVPFSQRGIEFDAGFDKEGSDFFTPPYSSSISIGMFSEEDEVIHIIWIWQCERSFLGLPASRNIPGSKVFGTFMDETFEEIQEELKELMDEFLSGR